jgi:glycine/D-amino acid oxidase-like deaminating enzyme
MCGQGFMLGPGMGELITRICLDELTESDLHILQALIQKETFLVWKLSNNEIS